MKKLLNSVLLVVLMLAVIFICTGCCRQSKAEHKFFSFKDMSQTERKEYICSRLKQSYNLDCEIEKMLRKNLMGCFFMRTNISHWLKTLITV